MIIYWDTLEKNAGDPAFIPDYIASLYFTSGFYPAAAKQLLALGPSGDLVLPAGLRLPGPLAMTAQPCVGVKMSVSQGVPSATFTKVQFDTEDFDLSGEFDTANNRFVAGKAGYYWFSANVVWDATLVADKLYVATLYKNGVRVRTFSVHVHPSHSDYIGCSLSGIIQLAATDYIEVYVYHKSTEAEEVEHLDSYWSIFRLC